VTDSLYAAAGRFRGDSASWERFRRLFATALATTQAYPMDPQAWYTLGEVRLHYGPYAAMPLAHARAAFERAVQLDSAFAPAYLHLIELSLLRDDPEAAQHYVERYLAQGVSGLQAVVGRLIHGLLDPREARSPRVQALLDTLPAQAFQHAAHHFDGWPDSAETAVRITRAWAASEDSVQGRGYLAFALAHRGHLRDAYAAGTARNWPLMLELAHLGIVPPEIADSVAASSLEVGNSWLAYGSLGWWAARGDTLMLDRATSWFEEIGLPYALGASRGYRALATGDSAAALEQFATLRTWPCIYCYHERRVQAQLLAAVREYEMALALLDEWRWPVEVAPRAEMVQWALERARINDLLGNHDAARVDYSYVLDAWRNADPELQPYVAEARGALLRLAGETQD
jgi:serine/threonine-protein kinase